MIINFYEIFFYIFFVLFWPYFVLLIMDMGYKATLVGGDVCQFSTLLGKNTLYPTGVEHIRVSLYQAFCW